MRMRHLSFSIEAFWRRNIQRRPLVLPHYHPVLHICYQKECSGDKIVQE